MRPILLTGLRKKLNKIFLEIKKLSPLLKKDMINDHPV